MKPLALLIPLAAWTLSACSTAPATPAANADTLQAYTWNMQTPAWRLPGQAPLQLHFDGQRLALSQLCNQASAPYQAEGHRLQLGAPMATLRACPDAALMQLEQRVLAQLPQLRSYAISGGASAPQLQLTFADGSQWQLGGQPTPATRFGGPGERIFLEVAAQTVACNHPLMPQAQCLRVRELHYNAQGLRQGSGEWQAFYGSIEGYQHQAGVRNVLRLQRYPAQAAGAPQPADAPRYAYVLDLVVESANEH